MYIIDLIRDSVTRFFTSGFFHESVSPQPPGTPLVPFRIFRKFAEIFASQGAPPVSTTPVVHLELRISPRIFEKNRNGPLRGLKEAESWKKPEVENLGTLSLSRNECVIFYELLILLLVSYSIMSPPCYDPLRSEMFVRIKNSSRTVSNFGRWVCCLFFTFLAYYIYPWFAWSMEEPGEQCCHVQTRACREPHIFAVSSPSCLSTKPVLTL